MCLTIKKGTSMHGKLIKGYMSKWDWTKNKGSYEKKVDFLSIHWEIHNHQANEVKLHVESPEANVDSELNSLKIKIINDILSKMPKIESEFIFGKIIIGTRLQYAYSCRSTGVFKVVINNRYLESTFEENIKLVHDQLGNIIDETISSYLSDIEYIFTQ